MTDFSTGWSVSRSVANRGAKWVFDALEHVIPVFPFPIISPLAKVKLSFYNLGESRIPAKLGIDSFAHSHDT
ncbi:hypothetical protein M1E17_09540 [Arthrobacter sp. D1-29]